MIRLEIMTSGPHADGVVSGLSERSFDTPKAAQEYAAHWAREMIEKGFMPEGMLVTYLVTAGVDGVVLDVVTYKHTEDAVAPSPEVTAE